MLLIIHDIETLVVKNRYKSTEIIEIGAVSARCEHGKLVQIDTFQSFVKPSFTKNISESTTNLTGITNEDVVQAPHFPSVFQSFLEWIRSQNDPDYFMCSWSLSDKDIFKNACKLHKIGIKPLKNYNDVQRLYSIYKKVEHQISLSDAVQNEGIQIDGNFHRALFDSVNTFMILNKIYMNHPIQFETNNPYIEKNRMVYGSKFTQKPFQNLNELLFS